MVRRNQGVSSFLVRTLAAPVLIVAGTALAASPAWAAGTSYTGSGTTSGSTPSGPSTPPGFTNIVTTQSVQPSGGTVHATVGSSTVSVTVPSGSLSAPTQVVVSSGTLSQITGLPAGSDPVLAVGVSFEQNGQKFTGTFPTPVTVTITGSTITTGDQVEVYDPSSGTYVPASQAPDVSNLVVANGTVTFQVLGDPYLAVTASAASTTAAGASVPGATNVSTGVPILGETLGGAALVLAGLLMVWRLKRSAARETA